MGTRKARNPITSQGVFDLSSPRKLVSLLFLVVAALVLAACNQPSTTGPKPDPAPAGVIFGSLTDTDGAPVANQQVVLSKADSLAPTDLTAAAATVNTTDDLGRFAFDVATEGTYTLTSLTDTTGVFAAVTVTRGPDGKLVSDELELKAAALGSVSGSVRGHGAGVMVFLTGTSFLALTDDDGEFVISRVPAGSYSVRAGNAGATGGAEAVTVTAGAHTELERSLTLGPVIDSVSPQGLMVMTDEEWAFSIPESEEYVLTGSGFGTSPGLSRLHYGQYELPYYLINSWSDEEIRVSHKRLAQFMNDTYTGVDHELEDFRFRLVALGGESRSDVSLYSLLSVSGSSSGDSPDLKWARAVLTDAYSTQDIEVPVRFSAVNGKLVDEAGEPLSEGLTESDPNNATFFLQQDGALPVVVSVEVTHALATQPEPLRAIPFGPVVSLDPYVPGDNVTGRMVWGWESDAEPVADDGKFELALPGHADVRGPVEIDDDGYFTAEISVPADEDYPEFALLYDGVVADYAFYY